MRHEIALRISGEDLKPEEVNDLLGMVPDHFHKKGDERTGKSGKCARYKNGVWAKTLEEESKDFLGRLWNHIKELEQFQSIFLELQNKGYYVDLFCGIWYESAQEKKIELSREIIDAAKRLGIDIIIDSYNVF